MFFRSPYRLDHINASKVSASAVPHLTDVCRSNFDMAMSMLGSNHLIGSFQVVSTWLCDSGVSQVSHLDFWCLADFSRFDLEPSVSPLTSNISVSTLWTFQGVSGWLHSFGKYPVSHFVLSHWFLIDMLDLDLYRFNLHLIVLTAGSNDPIQVLQGISRWLHNVDAL